MSAADRPTVLLLGSDGQLGHELQAQLAPFADVRAASRREIDVADLEALRAAVGSARPQMIINAAAYNDVDGAERDRAGAMRVNAEAVAVLGEQARLHRAALVHYSTDYVFDGAVDRAHRRPYREDDPTNPLGAYGESKLEGELRLLALDAPAVVFRTAWVWSLRRKNFVTTILRLARERERLTIVSDQVGNPTSARDLADATARLLYRVRADPFAAFEEARGVYHLAGAGHVDRHAFALAILALDPSRDEQVVKEVVPIASSAFPQSARRPLFAPLDSSRARARLGLALPHWRESLGRALGLG